MHDLSCNSFLASGEAWRWGERLWPSSLDAHRHGSAVPLLTNRACTPLKWKFDERHRLSYYHVRMWCKARCAFFSRRGG
jgi:hypothetical protein